MSDDSGELTWQRLIDVGLAHVEHLYDAEQRHEVWQAIASDGSALIWVQRERFFTAQPLTYRVRVYRPGPRPAGATSSMRNWVFDWETPYTDVRQLLEDVAAVAG